MICIGLLAAFVLNDSQLRNPLKKRFFQKMCFFGELVLPSVILVKKPLKALSVRFKMVYQHLLYLILLWILVIFAVTDSLTSVVLLASTKFSLAY